jgi:peptide/nickel transport system permease protein
MSNENSTPSPRIVAALDLPDIIPPITPRKGLVGLFRRQPAAVIGALVLVLMVAITIAAPLLTVADPAAISPSSRIKPPSATHLFGTDLLGRDVYSRVIYGARVSLLVGFSVALLASVAGTLIGLVSGFVRWADGIIMRMIDGLMAIPPVLLAIALMALAGGSIFNVVIAVSIAETPRVARLIRSVVLSLREQPYVDAAVTSGSSGANIILRHLLPNTIAPLSVQATYICGSAMIVEAILSFIGAGVPPTIPSWGTIMADGRTLWQVAPQMVLFPALFLSCTVLSVNLVGDGLRDSLDPRLMKKL